MLRGYCISLLLLFTHLSLFAQESPLDCKWVSTFDKPVVLDSLTVIPESIKVDEGIRFEFNLSENEITIAAAGLDSVRVCYRTLPFDLHSAKANRTLEIYDSTALFKDAILYQQSLAIPKREEVFQTDGIQKTGSITRGISFGNRQDVFVNSSLNLQMEGQLTENVNLRAVITDRNVPFQPEGNTQQIQDFDNIYIQLYNDNWSLKAGDVVLRNGASNFLRYYKNVQGAQLRTSYEMANGFKAETTLAASVAKGRFNSDIIEPIEGVLGPYRVRGPNNERFVIIIAGSEKVFLDGRQLTRGFNNDYVVDYNLGEITFTNRVLITQFSRIRVDFEFADQNYTRSILQASHYQYNDKFNFALNYYREKDNRNQPLSFELSNQEQIILSNAGDDLTQAVTTRVDSVGFTPDLILYRRTEGRDNLGNAYDIFQYSTNPDSAHFTVQFSEVGLNQGNYILLNTTANGRIFEWIAPVNGELQGNYEPISQLNAPNQRQMFTAAAGMKLNEYDVINLEVATSVNDQNLFSELDAEDDRGFAYKAIYESKNRPLKGLTDYKFNALLSYEFNNKYFSFIDRVRYIEFDRDWSFNVQDLIEPAAENILNAGVSLQKNRLNGIDYKLVRRKRGAAVDGFQHVLSASKELGPLLLRSDLFVMNNDQLNINSEWTRLNTDLALRTKWFTPGYRYRVDRNAVKSNLDNAVLRTAMNFSEHSVYIKNSDTLNTTYGIDYSIREDRLPMNGELIDNNRSETWNAFFKTQIDETQNLNILFTYRNLENLNVEGEDRNDETIMGRVDWTGQFFKRAIQSELSYNLSNSRELRREFIFLQVPTGEGTHTWRDDNGDGVQDLSEFYLAVNADERNYAKIFVPTDTYEEAFNTNISYRLRVQAPGQWKETKGLRKFLSQLSNNTSWTLNSKITDDNLSTRLLPLNVSDDALLSSRENLRSTLFYNKSRSAFAADFGIAQTLNKQLLTNGFESLNNKDLRAHIRWKINRKTNLDLTYIDQQRASNSDVLLQRNYLVSGDVYRPTITWQPINALRLTGGLSLRERRNGFTESSTERSEIREVLMDLRYAKAAKTTLNATFKLINIDFTGDENSAVGYELLEALRPGKNYTWNLNIQQRLGNGLQLSLRYDGRKSGDSNTVHVGRVQVSALF